MLTLRRFDVTIVRNAVEYLMVFFIQFKRNRQFRQTLRFVGKLLFARAGDLDRYTP
jgi:hypothetical protein